MLAEKYRKVGFNQLDVKAISTSKAVREALSYLVNNQELRIIYAPRSEWGGKNNPPDFLGAWLVNVSGGVVKRILKIHGRTINNLFDSGVLEIDRDDVTQDSRIALFKLSKDGKSELRSIKREVLLDNNRRVTRGELNALAQDYGLKINYNMSKGLFELLTLDGKKLTDANKNGCYIMSNANGQPVTRLNDLSWLDWEEFLHLYSRNKI